MRFGQGWVLMMVGMVVWTLGANSARAGMGVGDFTEGPEPEGGTEAVAAFSVRDHLGVITGSFVVGGFGSFVVLCAAREGARTGDGYLLGPDNSEEQPTLSPLVIALPFVGALGTWGVGKAAGFHGSYWATFAGAGFGTLLATALLSETSNNGEPVWLLAALLPALGGTVTYWVSVAIEGAQSRDPSDALPPAFSVNPMVLPPNQPDDKPMMGLQLMATW